MINNQFLLLGIPLVLGFGHAHFIHCMYSQWTRKIINTDWLIKFSASIVFSALALFITGPIFLIITIGIFSLHCFFDELYIQRKKATIIEYGQLLLATMAFITLSVDSGPFLMLYPHIDPAIWIMTVSSVISIVFQKDKSILKMLTLPWLISLLLIKTGIFNSTTWMFASSIVVMVHYLRWNIYMFKQSKYKKKFINETLIITSILISFFLLFLIPGYAYKFVISNHDIAILMLEFSIFTNIHVFTTIRKKFTNKPKGEKNI